MSRMSTSAERKPAGKGHTRYPGTARGQRARRADRELGGPLKADRFPAGEGLADLAASDRPFRPDECAALADRAAGLVDTAALLRTDTNASFVLWHDEHSVAWLNVMPERRDTG